MQHWYTIHIFSARGATQSEVQVQATEKRKGGKKRQRFLYVRIHVYCVIFGVPDFVHAQILLRQSQVMFRSLYDRSCRVRGFRGGCESVWALGSIRFCNCLQYLACVF